MPSAPPVIREKKKDYKLSAWIEKATFDNLERYCDEHDCAKSRVMELALKELLGMRRKSKR